MNVFAIIAISWEGKLRSPGKNKAQLLRLLDAKPEISRGLGKFGNC
jgi:hypothetical protein